MHTILGAGGAIGAELVNELAQAGKRVCLVGRNPTLVTGATQVFSADLLDLAKTIEAVSGLMNLVMLPMWVLSGVLVAQIAVLGVVLRGWRRSGVDVRTA